MAARIINPHNVLPFYTERDAAAEECPLMCDTLHLLPWNIELASAPSSVDAVIVALEGGTEYSVEPDYIDTLCTDDGKSYVQYRGATLFTIPPAGEYRVKLTIDGVAYWSHKICMTERFNRQQWVPEITCSGGNFVLDFGGEVAGAPVIEIDMGTGFEQYNAPGQTSASFPSADFIGSGEVEYSVRFRTVQPDSEYFEQYSLSFDTAFACSTAASAYDYSGGDAIEKYAYIEFWNSTDLENLGLLYQFGLKQRFYFENAPAFPVAVSEETFIRNQQGAQVLQSAVVSEQENLECYPVPPHLAAVFQAARYHDNIVFGTAVDANTEAVENFRFATRQAEGAPCLIGQISFERNRAYVTGCEGDKTVVAC